MNYLQAARAGGYAVGAFIVDSLDAMEGVAAACGRAGLPAVMMAGMNTARFLGPERYVDLCRSVGRSCSVPVYAHLDHCTDPALLLQCARAGFDCVMFDGSQQSFEKNISAVCGDFSSQNTKQGGFSCAVYADNGCFFPFFDMKGNLFQYGICTI